MQHIHVCTYIPNFLLAREERPCTDDGGKYKCPIPEELKLKELN
jgi:hypothetical protein